MAKSWQDIANQARGKAESEQRVWEYFRSKLESLQSFKEAEEWLQAEYPQSGSPGHKYYSNFAFFMKSFVVPCNANEAERSLYIKFVQRLDETGILKEGAAAKVLNALQTSPTEHPYT
jgi:hypothetical protein